MKFAFHTKDSFSIAMIVAISVATVFIGVKAGSLNPSSSPAATFYSLSQIFNPLASTSYDSSGITADANGSLIEILRYTNANLNWFGVAGNTTYTSKAIQVGGTATVSYSRFGTTATTHSNYISAASDLMIGGDLEVRSSVAFGSFASIGNAFFVSSTKKRVGIGLTSEPIYLLDVASKSGDAHAVIRSQDNGTADLRIGEYNTSNEFYGMILRHVGTGGIEGLDILTDVAGVEYPIAHFDRGTQKVGIGETKPLTKLDITGTVSASNGLFRNSIQVGPTGASTSYSRLWDGASLPGQSLTNPYDLYVGGTFELDGAAYLDNTVTMAVSARIGTRLGVGSTSTPQSSFELTDSLGTSNNIASISSTTITSGNVIDILVPVSSSFTGSIFKATDTSGRILFRVKSGGELTARQGVFSHGSVTNCTGVDTPQAGCIDYAEDMPTVDDSLEAGEVIMLDESEDADFRVIRSQTPYTNSLIGVVSTNPAIVIGNSVKQGDFALQRSPGLVPVALAGRVPVKISYENGNIKKGDYLTSSSVSGKAMKATRSGRVIGMALESAKSSRGDTSVFIFVNPHYAGIELDASGKLASFGGLPMLADSKEPIFANLLQYLESAVLKVRSLVAKNVETDYLDVKEGITTYDKITRETYCIQVSGGQLLAIPGVCGSLPAIVPIVAEPVSETPAIIPELSIEPTPEPTTEVIPE